MNRLVLPWILVAIAACAEGVATDAPTSETSPTKPGKGTAATAEPIPEAGADAEAEAEAVADAGADAPADAPADAEAEAEAEAAAPFVAPTVDGTISAGEYGAQNQATGPTTSWLMTWDDDKLYVGVSGANVAEGVVIYVETAPLTPSTSGTNADGSLAGTTYDGTRVASLPFRADFAAYVKSTYQEHRAADGANGWTAPVTNGIDVAVSGNVREIAIPWTAIRAGGRPSSFAWVGYATSASGYVYGQMPASNPGANVGLSATFGAFYRVDDTTQRAPFATVATP